MPVKGIRGMKLSEHKDLKKEILNLPEKEKDKLLLRLIAKDKVLTEHLHFVLLEGEADLHDRVDAIKQEIREVADSLDGYGKANAKDALAALRKLVKLVNHNLRVTKAAFEDVDLRIFLYSTITTSFRYKFFGSYKDYEQAFYIFYLKAVQVTLNKYRKLHEDHQYDLGEQVNALLKKIYAGKMANEAASLGLPKTV